MTAGKQPLEWTRLGRLEQPSCVGSNLCIWLTRPDGFNRFIRVLARLGLQLDQKELNIRRARAVKGAVERGDQAARRQVLLNRLVDKAQLPGASRQGRRLEHGHYLLVLQVGGEWRRSTASL